MARDPIVEEVRRTRDAIAREYNYDIRAIVHALQRQEVDRGRHLVSLPPKRLPPGQTERMSG